MKAKRYNEEQIVKILQELASGQSIAETSRRYGVSENTIYRWRSKYGNATQEEIRKMRALEEENTRLKRIVANQAMDIDILKSALSKKL